MFPDATAVVDAGEPLAVEAGLAVPEWGPDEDYLFAVISWTTGLDYAAGQAYTAYTVTP